MTRAYCQRGTTTILAILTIAFGVSSCCDDDPPMAPVTCQQAWQQTYGGQADDWGSAIAPSGDGGHVIVGTTESFGAGSRDVYLLKIDDSGDSLWTRTFGGVYMDHGWSIAPTSDGGHVIAGSTRSFGGGSNVYLLKVNAAGDSVWTRSFGGSGEDYGNAIVATSDGGCVVAGHTSYDLLLIKVDGVGHEIWTRTYVSDDLDEAHSMRATPDGGYIIVGHRKSISADDYDVYVMKTDSSGDSLWTRTFGRTSYDIGRCVEVASNGGYIVIGSTKSPNFEDIDVYMIRIDAAGDSVWTRTIGTLSHEEGTSILSASDGGYLIAGFTYFDGGHDDDVYLIKTDVTGDVAWTRIFGGTGTDRSASLSPTSDGGFILVGATSSFGLGGYDVLLLKSGANSAI